MKVASKLPTSKPMLKKISEVLPDLFEGENMVSSDEINEMLNGGIFSAEQIEQMKGFKLIESEELEIKEETQTNEKPEIEKVSDDVRNQMKFSLGGFVFAKVPNTNKVAVRVVSLLNKDEAIEQFNERGLEGKEPTTPQIQIVFSAEGVFGGFSGIMSSIGVQNRKGNETLFIINQNITQSEYNQLSQNPIPDCEYKLDEYRVLKGNDKLEVLNFQTDLNGGTIETAYKCFVVTSNKTRDIVVLKENEDGNGFNLGAKPFDNVAKHN